MHRYYQHKGGDIMPDYINPLLQEKILPQFLSLLKQEKTKQSYHNALKEFAEFIQYDVLSATKDQCEDYQNHLKDQSKAGVLKYSTALKKRKQIASLFNYIEHHREEYELFDFCNHFKDLVMPIPPNSFHEQRIPKVVEIDQLIGYLKNNDMMCLAAVLLSFRCLLTTEEIMQLKINNFYQDTSGTYIIKLIDKKSNSYRYCSVPDDVMEVLDSYFDLLIQEKKSTADQDLMDDINWGDIALFDNFKGGIYTLRTLLNRLSKAFLSFGSKVYTFNDLRNTGAVFAYSNHADTKLIANSLGYKTTRHIQRLSSLKVHLNDANEYINIKLV